MPSGSRWGPWRSLVALSPILLGAPWLAYDQHYKLPEPLSALTNPVTKLPQISEERILGFAKHLSEGIGYRIVGTYEHALADDWMVEAAEKVKRDCERVVSLTKKKLQCEVWRQEGSGNHRFDMMGKRLYKTYVNLSNIVVRISDGTDEGKEHALLVNAHLDSTIPSPGAADDALSVGIMLDCMRVLIETPDWSPKHAIIFLFNNAEESLQDGSHLFATQHPIASTVRAVINLEAAGTTGRELLFQATSQEMIDVYSRVPRPYGTIFANEIFSSGILLSDTDFRQFELYLNVTGLDMAVVGNSYLYHMRKDLVENIQPGVAQNMAENVLSLIRDLSSSNSPLPSLTAGYTKPTTVFFSHLYKSFFMYSYTTAKIMYTVLLVLSVILVRVMHPSDRVWREQLRGCFAVLAGVIGALLVPNLVAIIMTKMDKTMSWFTRPLAPIALYGPAGLLGALISQYLIGETNERSVYTAMLLIQSFIALAVQLAGIGSAAMFFLAALPIFISILLDPLFASRSSGNRRISLWTYVIGQTLPLLSASQLLYGTIEVFVPLTGRMGSETPADNIIATIVASLTGLAAPLVLPFCHRFGRKALLRGVINMFILLGILMAMFSLRIPFDRMHQKRLFVIYQENIATGEHHLHVATADGAPGFDALVKDIAEEFGESPDDGELLDVFKLKPVVMDDHNADWDHLYPFSSFLRSYKIPLVVDSDYVSPWNEAQPFTVSAFDHKSTPGTRNVTITVNHPGLIWTVVAFDAHVLHWSLDDNPPDEHARHHIKEASYYEQDTYSFNMVIKDHLPASSSSQGGGGEKIRINFVGMQEKGIWPAKNALGAEGGIAMELFETLDTWLDKRTHGTVDGLLMGCVIGTVDI